MSVSESIMGFFFTSSQFISQFPPTRFPLITATRMCHFLPVHHLEWHFWPGQNITRQLKFGGSYRRDVVGKATPGRRGPQEALMNWGPEKMEIRCSKESHHSAEWALGLRLSSPKERYFSYVRSPAPSHSKTPHNLFEPL